MQKIFKFQEVILLDNDPIQNLIHARLLKDINPALIIHIFNDPIQAIDFIKRNKQIGKTLLLLDIYMPQISGWQFLIIFQKLDPVKKNNIQITIVTASVSKADRDHSLLYPEVSGILIKPLANFVLEKILIA